MLKERGMPACSLLLLKRNKMKICITRSNEHSYSETFIRNQMAGLTNYAEIYSIYGGWLPEFDENNKLLNSKLFWLINKIYKNVLKKESNYFGNYGIENFLIKHKIETVLANYGVGGVKLLPICRHLNIPMAVHFHGFDASHYPTLQKYQLAYRELFQYAYAIIAVSKDMAKWLIDSGASPDKVHVNVYGIDVREFTPGNSPGKGRDFIAVARFAPKKAPQHSIDAFNKVLASFPDATLTMVGAKEEQYENCVKLVRELNIADKVFFTGEKSPREIVPLLQKSRAFIQHSVVAPDGDSEGTPNSILEAAACGLPVVSTLHAGIKDAVIHGETGYLVAEHDIAGMAAYMIQLAGDPALSFQLGQNGRKHVMENYDLKQQINKLYHIIAEKPR